MPLACLRSWDSSAPPPASRAQSRSPGIVWNGRHRLLTLRRPNRVVFCLVGTYYVAVYVAPRGECFDSGEYGSRGRSCVWGGDATADAQLALSLTLIMNVCTWSPATPAPSLSHAMTDVLGSCRFIPEGRAPCRGIRRAGRPNTLCRTHYSTYTSLLTAWARPRVQSRLNLW